MPRLTALDEHFVHQIPEPLPVTAVSHQHWRESYFFGVHERGGDGIPTGDVVCVAMATYPARATMEGIVLGRVGGVPFLEYYLRDHGDDPLTTTVGPVEVTIDEPYTSMRLRSAAPARVTMDIALEARSAPYALRRGRLTDGDEVLWDQSHMIQSLTATGTYTADGATSSVDGWWGQRDHSWGIRNHDRVPFWTWHAVQLDDGMLGVWCWEAANGARVFTDGCWAPAGGGEPVPVTRFEHELQWQRDGGATTWGTVNDPGDVVGVAGRTEYLLADGRSIAVEGEGRWCFPYGPFHPGGLSLLSVRTDDGRDGIAIYELTGNHHHRYFPTPLGGLVTDAQAPAT